MTFKKYRYYASYEYRDIDGKDCIGNGFFTYKRKTLTEEKLKRVCSYLESELGVENTVITYILRLNRIF